MNSTNSQKKLSLSDRPLSAEDEDLFDIDHRFVDKIYNLIKDDSLCPLTIAITGEWGVGKSSVINRLCEKIKKEKENDKTILICFEPLIEGKLEVYEIIELFYLKLYQNIQDDNIKEIVKKCLNSALVILNIFRPNFIEGVEKLLNVWKQKESYSFSDQITNLNNVLCKNEYKLIVIIDEVDRLSAHHIMNFLIFSRILECFQNLICIVSLDYKQVISKIINERQSGLLNYDDAKAYLDKLFQVEFHISIEEHQKVNFTLDKLRLIDNENILSDLISSNISYITKIIEYLQTPRQIKKWLISVKINYFIIKKSHDKLIFLKLIAVFIKHPVMLSNFTNSALSTISKRVFNDSGIIDKNSIVSHIQHQSGVRVYDNHESFVGEKWASGENPDKQKFDGIILEGNEFDLKLVTLGVTNKNIEKNQMLKYILGRTTNHPVKEDALITGLIREISQSKQIYLIFAFINNFTESEISRYQEFFEGDVNECIKFLNSKNDRVYHLAYDIESAINSKIFPKNSASVQSLNELWKNVVSILVSKHIINIYENMNPYKTIIFFLIGKILSEKTILELDILLSGKYIDELAIICKIKQSCEYKLDGFVMPDFYLSILKIINPKPNKKFFLKIIQIWLEKVNRCLMEKKDELFGSAGISDIFSWFIMWQKSINKKDMRKYLSNLVLQYLNSHPSQENNIKNIIENLSFQCAFYSLKTGIGSVDPLEFLFDNNIHLLKKLSSLAEGYLDIKYREDLIALCNTQPVAVVT